MRLENRGKWVSHMLEHTCSIPYVIVRVGMLSNQPLGRLWDGNRNPKQMLGAGSSGYFGYDWLIRKCEQAGSSKIHHPMMFFGKTGWLGYPNCWARSAKPMAHANLEDLSGSAAPWPELPWGLGSDFTVQENGRSWNLTSKLQSLVVSRTMCPVFFPLNSKPTPIKNQRWLKGNGLLFLYTNSGTLCSSHGDQFTLGPFVISFRWFEKVLTHLQTFCPKRVVSRHLKALVLRNGGRNGRVRRLDSGRSWSRFGWDQLPLYRLSNGNGHTWNDQNGCKMVVEGFQVVNTWSRMFFWPTWFNMIYKWKLHDIFSPFRAVCWAISEATSWA